jgi:glutathione S-transferase
MSVAGQHLSRLHPDPQLSLRLHRAERRGWKPDRAAIDALMPAVREQIAVLDSAVAASGYLVGDLFTFADINLMPILYRFRQAPEGAKTLGAASHLSSYYERHAMRPSFVRTIPPPGVPGRTKPN